MEGGEGGNNATFIFHYPTSHISIIQYPTNAHTVVAADSVPLRTQPEKVTLCSQDQYGIMTSHGRPYDVDLSGWEVCLKLGMYKACTMYRKIGTYLNIGTPWLYQKIGTTECFLPTFRYVHIFWYCFQAVYDDF